MAGKPLVSFGRLQVRTPWWLILVVFFTRAGFRLVRFVFRHRRALPGLAAVGGLLWLVDRYGWQLVALVAVVLVLVVLVWWWRARSSCRRWLLLPVLSRWRRLFVYRWQWAETFTLSRLHKSHDGGVLLPRLVGVRCKDATDEVVLRMLRGQSPEDYHRAAVNLAYSFGFRHCRVFSMRRDVAPFRSGPLAPVLRVADRVRYRDRPRLVTLLFIRRDALSAVVRPLPVASVPDFRALPVGMREDMERYALRLLASHVLVVGATRAGKGSVIWSLVRSLAGGVASGLVRLWGVDPKGGVELGIGQPLFARYEDRDFAAMADMFEDAVAELRRRQSVLRGKVRVHTPTLDEPLIVIVVDEFSTLTAYLPDSELRNRIGQAMGLILSQGAGCGVLIVAATQDPRKETLTLRDLFPTRIALRVNESNHVDLALGDGARNRGALADQIPNNLPGVGYVFVEGHPEAARVRFSYLNDNDIRDLAATYPAPRDLDTVSPVSPAPAPARPTGKPRQPSRRYRPGVLADGPLLPTGLVDALGHNGNGGGAEQ